MTSNVKPRKLIVDFANDNPPVNILQFIRDDPAGFSISDLSAHGMMNTIFCARSADGKQSVIIKYGETTARCSGISQNMIGIGDACNLQMDPTDKASLERQVIEYSALELLQSILPGSAPKPYCLDRTHNTIAMEDMSSWELLGSQLQAGRVDVEAAANLGHLLANMHISTSKKYVTTQRWEELLTLFHHADMKNSLRDFQFERAYDETRPDNIIPESALPLFKESVKEIKDLGISQKQKDKFNALDCFVHADCHWKSVFIKDGQTALLDFEFSTIGAAAHNVAMPITAYLFCYNNDDSTQKTTPEKLKFQTDCVQAVSNFLKAYIEKHPNLCDKESQAAFLVDVALFLGGALVLLGTYFAMDEFNFLTDVNRIFLLTRGFLVMKAQNEMNDIDTFVNTVFQI